MIIGFLTAWAALQLLIIAWFCAVAVIQLRQERKTFQQSPKQNATIINLAEYANHRSLPARASQNGKRN